MHLPSRIRLFVLGMLVAYGSAGFSTIRTTSLPNGTVGVQYSAQVYATGLCTPIVWTIPTLPPGIFAYLQTDSHYLLLSGMPAQAGTYSLPFMARGCRGGKSYATFTVIIAPPVTPVKHIVDLHWIASTSPLLGYNVYRSTTSGTGYTKINASIVAATLYTDGNVANGKTYYYVTTAVNSSGQESLHSNQVAAAIPLN
jgi:hypothetical protein